MRNPSTNRIRKNVTLVEYEKHGVTTYKLIGPTGEIKAVTVFADTLLDVPFNTRRAYCSDVADFFDYGFEAAILKALEKNDAKGLSKTQLKEIIESWRDYLTLGKHSGREIVRSICSSLPSPYVNPMTAARKQAALQKFLLLSDRIREETSQFVYLGLTLKKGEIDASPIFYELNKSVPIATVERLAMVKNSMISSVIASGPQRKEVPLFQHPVQSSYDARNIFPLDLVADFIDCLRFYRDKALYSLYAASGCRSSEGLQVLWSDIDVDLRTIKFVNYRERVNDPSYLSLTPKQKDRMEWKGRETDESFLIEPFATMFFENLEHYMRKEYYPHNEHSFVFQVLRKGYKGKPYFLTDSKTRQQAFDRAAAKMRLPEYVTGPHSLRHAYGTYLLNYIPTAPGQYGLPIGIVRLMMGHALVSSTEKYAVHDRDIIEATLAYSQLALFQGEAVKSLTDLKIEALYAQIAKFKKLADSSERKESV